MLIAGYILLGFSVFLLLMASFANMSTMVALLILISILIAFAIPGIVFLIIGYAIRKNKKTNLEPQYNCPKCGSKVLKNYVCCPYCGVKIEFVKKEKFCNGCGEKLIEEHSFCPYCGKKREN